eukprot:maker-scaffold_20-snap-gene-3.47-mRNA-1 protein AED:0.01 eAED:0.01 QI:76/1/1/1/1/1/3/31/647
MKPNGKDNGEKLAPSPITLNMIDLTEDTAKLKYQNTQLFSKVRHLKKLLRSKQQEVFKLENSANSHIAINSLLSNIFQNLLETLQSFFPKDSHSTTVISFLQPFFELDDITDITKEYFIVANEEKDVANSPKMNFPKLEKKLKKETTEILKLFKSISKKGVADVPKKAKAFIQDKKTVSNLTSRIKYLEKTLSDEKKSKKRVLDIAEKAKQRLSMYKRCKIEISEEKSAVKVENIKIETKQNGKVDDELKDKIREYEARLQAKEDYIEKLKQEKKKASIAGDSIGPNSIEVDDAKNKFDQQNQRLIFENESLRSDRDKLREVLASFETKIEDKFGKQIKALQDNIQQKEDQNVNMKHEKEVIQLELDSIKERYEQTKKMLNHYKEKVKDKSSSTKLNSRQGEGDVGELAKELDAVSKKLAQEVHRLNKTRHQYRAALKDKNQLELNQAKELKEKTDLERKLEVANVKLTVSTQKISGLTEAKAENTSLLTETKKILSQTEVEVHKLQRKLVVFQQENDKLGTQMNNIRVHLDTLKAENSQHLSVIEKVEEEKRKVVEEERSLRERLEIIAERGDDVAVDLRLQNMRRALKCPVNNSLWKDCVLKNCGHIFARRSLLENLEKRNRKCPTCKETYSKDDFIDVFLYQKN